ncbi:MAG: short-chain dehydrogenase/reductase [Beijerinckiaceae bacterium]|nr:MAG: short-chain dehydrogenase/reductase [Beijerinckiaceae bacterium]
MPSATAAPVAVISGGSSGIGLEVARLLAGKGYRLVLLAREAEKLSRAQVSLQAEGAPPVHWRALDVVDAGACEQTLSEIVATHGRIDWLVTSAGTVEPGMFLDLPADAHRRQMEINYFGTLNLVRPAARFMQLGGGGRITLISSAAAFVGIAGYSGYAPGKFAVRALAETLRVELAPSGISVGVAFPPDTDTPQLAAEQEAKPVATKRITAGGGVMSAERVARSIVDGALAGRFVLAPGALISLFGWVHSLYAPYFRWHQARILRRFPPGEGR